MSKKMITVLLGLVVSILFFLAGEGGLQADHMGTPGEHPKNKKRPLYSYEGNYRDQVNRLKEKFQQAFGYELMDLDEGWRPEEIEKLHKAFAQLPENFYRLEGVKGFYRASQLKILGSDPARREVPEISGIPAATLPRFTTVYRQAHKSYQVVLPDEPLRIEFYASLFYESEEDIANIVHHEMGHVFDLSHGFLTFQKEWLELSRFQILHLPALDGTADSDFLYTLNSDSGVRNYAPVSGRHLPTYSRENPQEDFANSVAAYIHYPYFKFTHPNRYRFLKQKVFHGKEYFSAGEGAYESLIVGHFQEALAREDWPEVIRLAREQSRFLSVSVEKKLVEALQKAVDRKISGEADLQLAIASCYLFHPQALTLRKNLLVARRIPLGKVLREERCRRMGARVFEGAQARWPLMQLRFYRENGKEKVQFLDPAALTAYARGFETRYLWQLSVTSPRLRVISKGEVSGPAEPNGAFVIDLEQSSRGRYRFPPNRELILEVRALRIHPRKPRPLESPWARLQLVVQPDFEYLGPEGPVFQVIYPPSWDRPD